MNDDDKREVDVIDASGEPETEKLSRWPGVVLSLFVPGFGLVRADRPKRFLVWLAGLLVLALLASLAMTWRALPNWCVLFVIPTLMLVPAVLMWRDSCRPGRMTKMKWLLFAGLSIAILVLPSPTKLVASFHKIATNAMAPTLVGYERHVNGQKVEVFSPDRIAVNRLAYLFSEPQRGDVVVFNVEGLSVQGTPLPGGTYVMRLVGLPGERISVGDGSITVNGQRMGRSDGIPDIHYVCLTYGVHLRDSDDSFLVPDGHYFMMGDNSPNSSDSRFWGPVPVENVLGKVTRVYYPFDRARVVERERKSLGTLSRSRKEKCKSGKGEAGEGTSDPKGAAGEGASDPKGVAGEGTSDPKGVAGEGTSDPKGRAVE